MTLEEFLKQDKPEQFDMKKLMHDYYDAHQGKHQNNEAYQAMLIRTGAMKDKHGVALWYDYKTLDKEFKGRRFDCDSSNETNDLMDAVYALLWWDKAAEWGISKKTFGNDTMNSFATTFNALMQKNDHKESYAAYDNATDMSKKVVDAYAEHTGYLGNFTLVPKGYNGYRGCSAALKDYWDLSLDALRRNRDEADWLEDRDMPFSRYINTFFLWDYVDETYHVRPLFAGHGPLLRLKDHILPRCYEQRQVNEFEEFMSYANKNIERRGIFMVAMLRIARASETDWKTIVHALATSERLGTMEAVLTLLAKIERLQDDTKAILQDALNKLDPQK